MYSSDEEGFDSSGEDGCGSDYTSGDEHFFGGGGGGRDRCNLCGRRADFVGPTRGFDYSNMVCGGCCDLENDDDDDDDIGLCRSCKCNLYKREGGVEGYCFDCTLMCVICGDEFIDAKEHTIPSDNIVRAMCEENCPDFQHEDECLLCNDCIVEWKMKSATATADRKTKAKGKENESQSKKVKISPDQSAAGCSIVKNT